MTVLVVEDNPARMKAFRQELIGTSVDFVTPASHAIQLLGSKHYKLVFLDYDLDLHGNTEPGTGLDVANWIANNRGLFRDTRFVVHSVNPLGGPAIAAALRKSGLKVYRHPYVWADPDAMAHFVDLAA